jgi:hypothetical protein
MDQLYTDMAPFSRLKITFLLSHRRFGYSVVGKSIFFLLLKSQDDEMVSLLIGYCEFYDVTMI